MDKEKRARLEKAGWKFGDAADFLGMSKEEQRYIDIQLAFGRLIREARADQGLSQSELAALIKSSQSRVSKMEAGKPTVSIDLQIRTLLALNVSSRAIADVFSDDSSETAEPYEESLGREGGAHVGA
jgi:ribosome-binding protein aMBF1 (putative translation factor)